jgi:hypothetical protein
MPTRLIRESILNSQRVALLDHKSRWFYLGLLLLADDEGRLEFLSTKLLNGKIFPHESIIDDKMDIFALNCVAAGLAQVYEVNGKIYVQLHDYRQQIRAASKYPNPPCIADAKQTLSTCLADAQQLLSRRTADAKPSISISSSISIRDSGDAVPRTIKKTFKTYTIQDFTEECKESAKVKNMPESMLQEFIGYWIEKSSSGLMRFQLEKTWETPRRMDTWIGNQARFGKKQTQKDDGLALGQKIQGQEPLIWNQ